MSGKGVYDPNFKLVPAMNMEVRPVVWCVGGYLEVATVSSVIGPPGAGKSFYVLDMGCCVATGQPFHGRDVLSGAVVYIAGEGYNGIARRMWAWAHHNGVFPKRLHISNKAIDLFNPSAASQLESEVEKLVQITNEIPRLIIVDTLARNFSADENSASDIGQFINNLDEIRFRWDSTVLIVHHTGKDLSRGARGSSAMGGAVDAVYEFTRGTNETILVACKKMREGRPPEPQSYELVDVDTSTTKGELIQSAVLQQVAHGSDQAKSPSGKNQRVALDVLRELYSEFSGTNGATPTITEATWRAGCQGAGLEPKRVGEAINGLIRNSFVKTDGNRVTLLGWEPSSALSEKLASATDSDSSAPERI